MKFDIRQAFEAVLGIALLCVIVLAFIGFGTGYVWLLSTTGEWLQHYFSPIPGCMILGVLFIGIPVFVLGGLGFYK